MSGGFILTPPYMTQVEHKCHMNLFEAPLSLSFYTVILFLYSDIFLKLENGVLDTLATATVFQLYI